MPTVRRVAPAFVLVLLVGGAAVAGCSGPSMSPAGTSASPAPLTVTSEVVDPSTQSQGQRQGQGAGGTDGRHGLPTDDELAQARQDVSRLDTRRLAAQLVVVRQPGTSAAAASAPVRSLGVGGVTAFAASIPRDVASIPGSVRAANGAIQRAMRDTGRDWPAFVAVDQEGGPVTRIGAPLTRWPAAMALGAAVHADLARDVARASGGELRGLGYTVVLAPVADVTIGPADPTIGVRSPSSSPDTVRLVAGGQVEGYLRAGVLPVVKHFPGHGGVRGDSHTGPVYQPGSRADLDRRDLLPFRDLATAGVPAVMTGHIVMNALDSKSPATLSAPVVDGLLRREWGYRGLVVTDALEMAAISSKYGPGEAAVRALLAGNDVLLMPADPGQAVKSLVTAVASGRVPKDRLVDAAARMVATLRHVTGRADVPDDQARAGSHAEVARRLAAASVTQLSGRCGAALVGRSVTVVGGTSDDRAAMTKAARAAGLGTSGGTRVALLGSGTYSAAEGRAQSARSATGDVVVALDTPYQLAEHPRAKAAIAVYGRTPETFRVLVDVLLGRVTAPGRLPVAAGRWGAGSGCAG